MMLSTLQTLRDRAIEAALQAGAARPPVNERWLVTDEELADVSVRWPVTYQWPTAKLWVEPLLSGFRKRTRVEFAELPQPYRGTVIFQFVMGGKAHDIAVDYSDYPEVNQESVARCAASSRNACAWSSQLWIRCRRPVIRGSNSALSIKPSV